MPERIWPRYSVIRPLCRLFVSVEGLAASLIVIDGVRGPSMRTGQLQTRREQLGGLREPNIEHCLLAHPRASPFRTRNKKSTANKVSRSRDGDGKAKRHGNASTREKCPSLQTRQAFTMTARLECFWLAEGPCFDARPFSQFRSPDTKPFAGCHYGALHIGAPQHTASTVASHG